MLCSNDVPIPIETSCRYLGHIITNDLCDNEEIRCQLRCFTDDQICCHVPLEHVRMKRNYFRLCHVVEICLP